MRDQHRARAGPLALARVAGGLYLIIIVCGVFTEVVVRGSVVVPGDAAATAANLLASEALFRFGFLTDSLMFLADVALAVLLFVLLEPAGRTLALVAAAFRLAQAAVLALNLLHQQAALLVLTGPEYASAFGVEPLHGLAYLLLDLHAHGYDVGLLLFGVHCLVLGYLIVGSGFLPKVLGFLMVGASVAYLTGSYTRFLFPEHLPGVTPVYVVAFVAEVALCGWLLVRGVDVRRWEERRRAVA